MSSAPDPDTLTQTKDETLGAVTIGLAFSLTLAGITLQQAATYYRQFPGDKKLIKWFVALLTFLNLLHTGAIIHVVYYIDMETWKDVHKISDIPATEGINLIMGGVISALVQAFYAYRIYILSKLWFISVIIIFGSFIQMGALMGTAIYGLIVNDRFQYKSIYGLTYTWFISVSIVDILTTTTVMYHIQRSRGVITKNTTWFNRISIVFLQTNFITGILVLACGSVFVSSRTHLWGSALYYVVVKMYLLSFFTSLNSRPSHDEPTFTDRSVTTTYTNNNDACLFPEPSDPTCPARTRSYSLSESSPKRQQQYLKDFGPTPPQNAIFVERRVSVNVDSPDRNAPNDLEPKVYKTFKRQISHLNFRKSS